jgi:DNA topoisomerase-6 subunit A
MPKKNSASRVSKQAAGKNVLSAIHASAEDIRAKIMARKKPTMKLPVRSLANVRYQPQRGFFEMAGQKKERTLTVNTVKTFAQTLRMVALSKELLEGDDIATKREAYYVSKNWEDARFSEQPESDTVMDDVGILQINRTTGLYPRGKGGVGTPDRGRRRSRHWQVCIDCTKFGSGAYSIPISVEQLQFETSASFILVIETAGMFQRLVKHNYWKKANCILISMGGVPTRACRRFIRRLADFKKIPVYVFVDGDPYGITNIYRTLKVGSGNAAHLNEFFCVPQARFLGITPRDIIDYKLPTHPLKDVDIKRARDAIKNDPFIRHYKDWIQAIEYLLEMGVRAEQQALAKHGLNYVIDTYLPEKLAHPERFLP